MGQRSDLHSLLVECLGAPHVYFQPPVDIEIVKPCIVYNHSYEDADYADNLLYRHSVRYEVTYISRRTDEKVLERIRNLRYSSFNRFFVSDDINHHTFNVYF